ncbi:hypothetical protein EDD85DRAFT_601286 [Armillaria nabsnona]|nr:hypothetical protein EDD85DRAFT_601286 [Armillaria nabsnona]
MSSRVIVSWSVHRNNGQEYTILVKMGCEARDGRLKERRRRQITYTSWTFTTMILIAHHNFTIVKAFSALGARVGRRGRKMLRTLYRDVQRRNLSRTEIVFQLDVHVRGYRTVVREGGYRTDMLAAMSIQDQMQSTSFFSTRTSMGLCDDACWVTGRRHDRSFTWAAQSRFSSQESRTPDVQNQLTAYMRMCGACNSPNIPRRC